MFVNRVHVEMAAHAPFLDQHQQDTHALVLADLLVQHVKHVYNIIFLFAHHLISVYAFFNSKIVVCQPSPCQNSGTCSVDATSSTGYKCTCSNGYSGVRCENGIYLWIKVFKHKKIFF